MQRVQTNQSLLEKTNNVRRLALLITKAYYKGSVFKTRITNRSMKQNRESGKQAREHLINVNSILEQ